jgi:hypothetical protein
MQTVGAGVPRFHHDPVTGESLGLLMEESRTNLFTYSDRFEDASWGKSNSIIVPNIIIAPSGDMVASKLVASNSLSGHYVAKSVALIDNTTYSFTIFLKSGEYSQARINFRDKNSSFNSAVVSLVDGSVIGTPGAGLTVTTKLLSNGWLYLVVVVQSGTGSGSPTFYIYPAVGGSDTFTGDGVSGIYIWRGGLEVGAFPTSSIETPAVFTGRSSTGTFIGSNGLIQTAASGVARYQYTPSDLTIPPYLLLESAGTNLFTYSDQFDNAYWGKVRGTINQNVIAAPDGTVTADKFVESTETGSHYLLPSSSSVVSGSAYTLSAFAKNAGRYLTLYFPSNGFGDSNVENASTFDLLNGLIYSSGSKVTTAISNVGGGWYRCVINKVATVSTALNIPIYLSNNGTSLTSYTGDGTSGVYLWGAQLEQSDRPSTYIPTTTSQVTRAADTSTSSQVTRAADSAVMTGVNFSSWYRQDEGTLFINYRLAYKNTNADILSISDGTSSELIQVRLSSTSLAQYSITDNGVVQASISPLGYSSLGVDYLRSMAYKTNDFSSSINASAVLTDTVGTVPTVNRMDIAGTFFGGVTLNGTIKKIVFYPKRLSNTELVGITQ